MYTKFAMHYQKYCKRIDDIQIYEIYCNIIFKKYLMSFLQFLFKRVSVEINKSYQDLIPFIKVLEQNWYDSEQALLAVTDEQFQSMKFPKRLVAKIKQILKKEVKELKQIEPQPKTIIYKQIQSQVPQKQIKQQIAYDDIFDNFIDSLKIETTNNKAQIIQTINLLIKIVENIWKAPEEEKFRKIKVTNKKFADCILQYNCSNYILEFLGFFKGKQEVYMPNPDLNHLNISLKYLRECLSVAQKLFDPYQASYNSSNQMPNAIQLAQQHGGQLQYNKMLDQLIQYRKKIMGIPPSDRQAKIYHKKYEVKNVNFTEVIFQDELEKSHDPVMQQYWKKVISMNQINSTFQNKRRIQFQALLKQPIYNKTLVKIRLPNDYILQGIFGPLQKIEKVVSFAKSFVTGDVYIYMAPPVVQMSKHLDKTLNELDCVPSGVFFLGSNSSWAIKNEFIPFILN